MKYRNNTKKQAVILNKKKTTTLKVPQIIEITPNNPESTTKLSYIEELPAMLNDSPCKKKSE